VYIGEEPKEGYEGRSEIADPSGEDLGYKIVDLGKTVETPGAFL